MTKFTLCATLIASLSPGAYADFLMCQDSQSVSEWRQNNSRELFNYLQTSPNDQHGTIVTILSLDEPNAYALHPSKIVVSSALLEALRSSSEEAFVLAHELGHLRGTPHSQALALVAAGAAGEMEISEEVSADRFAANLLELKGLNGEVGLVLLGRLQQLLDSPSITARQAALAAWVREIRIPSAIRKNP